MRFAHIGDTIYVRDVDLGIWDRAYMTCIAQGHLSYMRSPDYYEGVRSMRVHRSPIAGATNDTIESATDLLTPALAQAFQIEHAAPRFLVDENGAVRAVELLWPALGLRPTPLPPTHLTATGRRCGLLLSMRSSRRDGSAPGRRDDRQRRRRDTHRRPRRHGRSHVSAR